MTEKEKDQFIEQLQGEVKHWHMAYDASEKANQALVKENHKLKGKLEKCKSKQLKPTA